MTMQHESNSSEKEKGDNQTSWRHHYIPQFYLRGFTSENGKFKIFDVKKKRFIKDGKAFSPESYFFEKDANTLISENGKSDFVEKHYGKVDSRIAEIFNRINASTAETKFDLTDNDIAMLQHFVGVMYWRLPINFPEVQEIVKKKRFKEMGLLLKDTTTDELIDDPDKENKLKNDPNFWKAMKSFFPDLSFPENFNCITPLHILPFPAGLPAICGDNPIISKYASTFRVYTDDYIFPINSTKLFIRGNRSKDFYTSVKIYVDMIIYKQATNYVSCTDEKYIDQLDSLYDKHFTNLDEVRLRLFNTILDD
jgi:hypothetical protein